MQHVQPAGVEEALNYWKLSSLADGKAGTRVMGHSTGAMSGVEHKSVVTVLVKFSGKSNWSNWAVKHGVCNFGCGVGC